MRTGRIPSAVSFGPPDGGKNFEKVLYKDENTGAADLVMDPGNSNVLYAALWAARVAPWEVRSGESFVIPGSGFYKSVDGGTNWKLITKGLPTSEDGIARIGIAVAPSNPKRLYLSVEAQKGHGGVYASDDAGESVEASQLRPPHWRARSRGDGNYRSSPDNVRHSSFVANTTTWKSVDGGKTFVGFKGAPGGDDYQRIWINPEECPNHRSQCGPGAVSV